MVTGGKWCWVSKLVGPDAHGIDENVQVATILVEESGQVWIAG
jgi:hypothetical protein